MSEPHDLHDPALRDRAVRAARGQDRFDVLLTGGMVADVATGELRAADVGLVGPLIASVHPPDSRSDAREHVELAGSIIAPGLIDTHLHIESSMVTPRRYAEVVVPQGTTTICWDPTKSGMYPGWTVCAGRSPRPNDCPCAFWCLRHPACHPLLGWNAPAHISVRTKCTRCCAGERSPVWPR
jgi:adenine deaminase